MWEQYGLPPLTILNIIVPDFERFPMIELPGSLSGFLELLPEREGKER